MSYTQQNIDFGAYVGDPTADTTRAGFQKTQANMTALFSGAVGGGGTGNIIGGLSVDNPATAALVMTGAQITQMQGDALPAAILANNTYLGTTGYYWTAADATAGGGTVNLPALFNAAATWSSANGRAVRFPGGVYDLGTNQLNITQNNVSWLFDKDSRIQWEFESSGAGAFTITGNNFTCVGGVFGPPADTYQDFFTSVITQTVAEYGPTTVADLSDWRTVSCGNWAGLQIVLQWQTSTTTLFQANTNVTYHDTLPINPQTGQRFPSLATLQTYLNTFATVASQSNLFLCSATRFAGCPTIAGGSAVAAVTIGPWSGYQVTHTPPSGATYSVLNTSPGALPGQVRTAMSPTGNAISETVAIPQPTINFISGQPVFYQGGGFIVQANNATFFGIEMRNASGTRMLLKNSGNRMKVLNSNFWASDSTAGSAYIRIASGDGDLVAFCKVFSGDESLQFVCGSTWTGNGPNQGFNALSNLNITNGRYSHNMAVALGTGPVISASMKINNQKQVVKWTSSATVPVGNTITFPDPIPTGLTATMLQYSGQPWNADTQYLTVGLQVVNGVRLYTLVTGGISGTTGPTGNGSGIVDGTCVWNYVSGSAQNASSVYCSNLLNVVAGSLVSGYSHAGSTNTLTLTPPPGFTNAVNGAITVATSINFIEGIPLGALSNNIDVIYNDNYCIGLGGCVASLQNTDSRGSMRFGLYNNYFDSSWVNASNYSFTGKGAIFVQGDAYGGVSAYIEGNRLILPWSGGMWLNGTLNDYSIKGNYIDGSQLGSAAVYSAINIFGGNMATLPNAGGVIEDNTIWATQGSTLSPITLGANNTVDGMGEAIPGNAWNAVICKNRFYGLQDNVAAIQVVYGGNHIIKENTCYPATGANADAAQFISILNTSSGVVCSDYNNLTSIHGTPYVVSPGATLYSGQWELYNPSLTSPPTPNPPISIGPVEETTSILNGGTHTVAAFNGVTAFLLNAGAGSITTGTLVLPTGGAAQQFEFSTTTAIATLTVVNSTWPASTGLAANAGALFNYLPTTSKWYPASLP